MTNTIKPIGEIPISTNITNTTKGDTLDLGFGMYLDLGF